MARRRLSGTLAGHFARMACDISGVLFKSMADVDMVRIPYKGSGPVSTDLIGGHVQPMFDSIPSAPPMCGRATSRHWASLAVIAIEVVHPGPGWEVVAATLATCARSRRMDA